MLSVTQVEQRMRPGQASESGFLDATESLVDCCNRDLDQLQKLGITGEQIADRLQGMVDRTIIILNKTKKFSNLVLLEEKFKVKLVSYCGHQMCPFECGFDSSDYGAYDVTVQNVTSSEQIKFPGLIMHLIRTHGFFEGNTLYRLDPITACRVLVLSPGQQYKPQMVDKKKYQHIHNEKISSDVEKRIAKAVVKARQLLSTHTEALWIEDPASMYKLDRDTKPLAQVFILNRAGDEL